MSKTAVLFRTELSLWFRDFYSVFFTLVFPVLMLEIFGTMYGSEPMDGSHTMLDYLVPAYTVMIIGVAGLMDMPMEMAMKFRRGIYKRMDATPAGRGKILTCEILVNLLMVLLGIAIFLIVAFVQYDLTIDGSFFPIAGAFVLSTLCLFSMGFLFAVAVPSPRTSQLLCYVFFFVMLFLSGATLPDQLFPESLAWVAKLLPMTYCVDLMQEVFLAKPWADCASDFFAVCAFTGAFLAAGIFFFRRRDWSR